MNIFEKELLDIPFSDIRHEVQRQLKWQQARYEKLKRESESEQQRDPFVRGLIQGMLIEAKARIEDLEYLATTVRDCENLKEEVIKRFNLIPERRDV